MKRRYYIGAFVLLTGILLFCCSPAIRFSGTAILNGKTLSEPIQMRRFLFELHDDAILPLIGSYECLGYQTIWESDTVCRIEKEEEAYVLDLSERTLISVKNRRVGENLLLFPPGENHGVIRLEGKELYVNTGVFLGMQIRLGFPVHLDIDLWNRQVAITINRVQTDNETERGTTSSPAP